MNPRSLALSISLAFFVSPAAAQQPVAGTTSDDATMLATPRYLFVLRGDVLYQFDVDTLKLQNKVTLPGADPMAPQRAVTREELEGTKPLVRDVRSTRDSRVAVERGLQWLATHQDIDGKWDADDFMKHDDADAPTDGKGSVVHDVGVTGLALLAFLGDGNTLRTGPYKDVVRKAATWLKSRQGDDGLIGSNASHDFIYGHAIATMALSETYGLSDYKALRKTVQSAINYLEAHRNPYLVWRYQPQDNDNDTSVTMWCLMAYKSAQDFGININQQALKLIATWLDQVTDPVTGRAGYTKRGEPSSRMPGDHARRFPPEKGEALTAAALFGRFLLGQNPDDYPVMKAAAEQLEKKPPVWDEKAGTIDGYYWFFGSYAMYQMGGQYWADWSRNLHKAVLKSQRVDGSFAGSWDPVGVWGESGGRVYSTALMTLALEASYRYARIKGR